MLAALLATTLFVAPMPGDDVTRNVLVDVCLPFVGGDSDRAAAEFLGFVVTSEEGHTVDMATAEDPPSYTLQLVGDDGEDDGEVRRVCQLQARRINLDSAKGAVRRPLEAAGFVAEPGQSANRAVWTKGDVTVSLRQNEGRATVIRVSYSSVEGS